MSQPGPVRVWTEHPVAYESPDHLTPWGTSRDNSRNPRFNAKAYRLFENLGRQLRVLDLGCSGGGFVRDCLNDGCLAVGLEGSNYSLRMRRAEWAHLGNHSLFTADIARPFRIAAHDDEANALPFDLITSWDVLEHIAERDLQQVVENVLRHLAPTGICVFSISHSSDIIRGVELHQTIQPRPWWVQLFARNGLRVRDDLERYFNTQFVRGPKQSAPYSFHVVLSRSVEHPVAPALAWRDRVLDAWYFSAPQKALRQLLAFPAA